MGERDEYVAAPGRVELGFRGKKLVAGGVVRDIRPNVRREELENPLVV